jgi:hypothetical protein
MTGNQIEYIGFTVNSETREYTLRARHAGGEYHDFTLAISNEAFLDHRVRYQDAPDICFLKLKREMIECGDALPVLFLSVTDVELREYVEAHTPKPKKRFEREPAES